VQQVEVQRKQQVDEVDVQKQKQQGDEDDEQEVMTVQKKKQI
jgi:hypothetical protein